jgi:hypothetical protein
MDSPKSSYSPNVVEEEFCEVQSNKLPRITPVLCGRISYVKTKRGLWFCVYNSQGRYKKIRKFLLVTVVVTFRRRSPAMVVR